jgi:hypothetical protein
METLMEIVDRVMRLSRPYRRRAEDLNYVPDSELPYGEYEISEGEDSLTRKQFQGLLSLFRHRVWYPRKTLGGR